MSISGVSSAMNAYPTAGLSAASQRFKDMQSLGQALQSGDLGTAQSAFATFLQNFQNTSQASTGQSGQGPVGLNPAATKDVQSIQSALQSGDLTGAQKAFTQLKTDMRGGAHAHGAGHHRPPQIQASSSDNDDTTTSAANSTTTSTASTSSTSLADQLMQIIGGIINQQA